MPRCQRRLAAVAILTVLPALTALAQTSTGYPEPDDIDALLAYRLPAWSWRTWNGTLDFDGGGATSDGRDSAAYGLDLASDLRWQHESERWDWGVSWSSLIDGRLTGDHHDDQESDAEDLRTENRLGLSTRRYLGDSPFFAGGGGHVAWKYEERRRESDDVSSGTYQRRLDSMAIFGLGVGRVRNVTPLIRAERISARLVALGREPLTDRQVLAVAEAIARSGGYVEVYDRPDRHFWSDVLAPVLDPERPLTPYEVHYLEDVAREELDGRYQGAALTVSAAWQEWYESTDSYHDRPDHGVFQSDRTTPHRWALRCSADWYINPSLDTMYHLDAYAQFVRTHGAHDIESGRAMLKAAWLRHVADRHRLAVEVRADGAYGEADPDIIRRAIRTSLRVEDRIWVEDAFTLRPYAEVARHAYSVTGPDEAAPTYTSWSYGVELVYVFDSALN